MAVFLLFLRLKYVVTGASYIYGPQKGATSEDVKILDKILENYGNIIDNAVGKNFSEEPGSGAAGGLGYALLSICGAEFKEGIVKIMELIELENLIKDADLVITGEGRIDNQSVNGKADFFFFHSSFHKLIFCLRPHKDNNLLAKRVY